MTRYLIDIRIMGPVQREIRALSSNLQERFRIADNLTVPHITLAGPFSTSDEARLVTDFTRTCTEQTGVPGYELGGFGFFDQTRAVFAEVFPDEGLRQFRFTLATVIAPYCTLREYDRVPAEAFRFHATLAMKLNWFALWRIKRYIRSQEPIRHRRHPVRVTLLRNAKVLCEYDFVQARMLTPAQARSRATRLRDRDALRPWDETGGG